MEILDPVRLIMRQKACQICYKKENIKELNPFMNLETIDYHYGYQYCEKCKEVIYATINNLNELCKNIIEEKTNIKYDFFEIKDFEKLLKNKDLIVKRTNDDIEDDWKFSGYMYNKDIYIIVVSKNDEITKNIILKDFLEYNSYLFL